MVSRILALRHLASTIPRSSRFLNQRRWAQVHDVRFLATVQPSHSITERYQAKLQQKANEEGHKTVDDLKAAYADQIQAQRQRDVPEQDIIPQTEGTPISQPIKGPLPGLESEHGEYETVVNPDIPQAEQTPVRQPNKGSMPGVRQPTPGSGKPPIKALNDILNLERAQDLPEQELTAIWRLRHASDPQSLCAVIPSATYEEMEQLARKSPQFILPVPHENQGAEIHFLQWTWDAPSKTSTVLFTQLAEYKQRGEFAQPHTTVTHHLDLKGNKGLVLMQGRVTEDRGVKPEHAKWLVMSLQRFYGGWEGGLTELDGQRKDRANERKKLLEWFATGDPRFSVQRLMEGAERMG